MSQSALVMIINVTESLAPRTACFKLNLVTFVVEVVQKYRASKKIAIFVYSMAQSVTDGKKGNSTPDVVVAEEGGGGLLGPKA